MYTNRKKKEEAGNIILLVVLAFHQLNVHLLDNQNDYVVQGEIIIIIFL